MAGHGWQERRRDVASRALLQTRYPLYLFPNRANFGQDKSELQEASGIDLHMCVNVAGARIGLPYLDEQGKVYEKMGANFDPKGSGLPSESAKVRCPSVNRVNR